MKMSLQRMREYYKLTKPGIIYGNLLTTVAAFIFAWRFQFVSAYVFECIISVFVATVFGISFVIGSACVFNNYLDRNIDRKMDRTKHRALVTGAISARSALIFGTILGVLGLALLYWFVNVLTAEIALFGFIFYVGIYGFAKRASHWGAVVGSIPGAVPIVVGYTALANRLDATALVLFLILVAWQMPHFYAIATYRLDEYVAAGIPVLPAKKGIRVAKVHILLYVIAYLVLTLLFAYVAYLGFFYLVSVLVFGIAWLWRALQGFTTHHSQKGADEHNATDITKDTIWAKKTFLFSLIVLVSFCVTIAIAPMLP